ncbi:MAG: diversity-generating retroelement protein Avd [Bacillota bacterium]
MNEDYPLFVKWYKTLDWILDTGEKFPKNVRFSLTGRLYDMALDILEYIIEAIYTKERVYILKKINIYMEKLRVFYRLSFERRYISERQYRFISGELDESGRMVGGWIKQCGG